jgi:hypothetical protein
MTTLFLARRQPARAGFAHALTLLLLALLAALLTACGGGGGSIDNGGGLGPNGDGPPVITVQPADVTSVAGTNASFSVTAQGTGLAYQWMRSTNQGLTWVAVPGGTAASLTVNAVDATMNGDQYRVVIQNTLGIATSEAARLTVTPAGGGGGGGGNGSVPVACVPPNVLPVGMVIDTTTAIATNGIPGTPQRASLTVVGPSTFQGQPAFETRVDLTGTFLPSVARTFTTYDPVTRMLTQIGALLHVEVGGIVLDSTSVARQPAQYPLFTLAAGQSVTTTTVSDTTQVTTTNGVAGAPVTGEETLTTTLTFLGTETVTVPAGTFLTCKTHELEAGATEPTITWRMAGYGATVKATTGSTTQTLSAITVNGTPLTQFP